MNQGSLVYTVLPGGLKGGVPSIQEEVPSTREEEEAKLGSLSRKRLHLNLK